MAQLAAQRQNLSVVHINTHDVAGGAAKVAWRLMEAQRAAGLDSKILAAITTDRTGQSSAFAPEPDRGLQAYCRQQGQLFYEYQGSHRLVKNPLVQSADILHLHNLHGDYFNPFSLSALSHLKPVVWTLHDMQSITGHCAHSFDCQKWQNGCVQCPYLTIEPAMKIDSALQLLADKKLVYDHSYLWIVTPSRWLQSKVEKSILKDHPVELIYNGVDTSVFRPYDKQQARSKWNIPQEVFVVGAVGHGGTLTNQWKGGQYTQQALEMLWSQLPGCMFVNIGANDKSADPRIINIPAIHDENQLAQAYSALDVFLYTPVADNCPLVVLEALSCSVPIVTFATGGVPELVRHGRDGFVTAYQDVGALMQAVKVLAANSQLRDQFACNSRQSAVTKFDHTIIAGLYEKLYRDILQNSQNFGKTVKCFPLQQVPAVIKTPVFMEAEKSKEIFSVQQPVQEDTCDVSIILATKDRARLLDSMLGTLKAAMEGLRYEIIVIEGGSLDNTIDILRKHGITQIYKESECLGPGRHSWPQLYNFGFSRARGKWAMYASDDIVFGKESVRRAVELLNKQTADVAGGIFFYKNAKAEPGWDQFGIDFTYGPKLLMNYGLVRLDDFNRVGGLDESYKFYCADGDLCYKLYQSGSQLIPLPGCFVVHNNVLDAQKKVNTDHSGKDIELYQQRWGRFVSMEMPKPRRLLWQEDYLAAFLLPFQLQRGKSGIEYFWQGLACLQQGMPQEAKINFLKAVQARCSHWIVLWFAAGAAYGSGDKLMAGKAAKAVIQCAPNFQQAKDLLTLCAVD
jgi:glycosyltransferase involved in cell wall biosynthesis